ncbi:Cellulose synthase like E1 [Hibiscus syriacus]|uniref:Cellulose synthase like E1 n=1 Tax=Hibiscus syriacus TaxID=106335 RepID=A0A6A2WQL4_HIBSY|nr:Cellulose synthase like E1 [Hibiscus syriacus]
MAKGDYVPLFETRPVKGRILFRSIALLGICFICTYRVGFFPVGGKSERWIWIGLFPSELWFIFSWFLSTVCRWNSVYRIPYVHRLSQRFGKELPGVDIFVCTADPLIEPPSMVVNTVLSMMVYDYPPEKLSVYLSDDGGSDLTFYAMLAANFSMSWLPFCNKFKVEPRSPEAYFTTTSAPVDDPVNVQQHWLSVKKQYEDMKMRIETTTKLNRIPEHIRIQHKGFREWDFVSSKRDHQTILQILIDGRDPNAVDIGGNPLPTLVYLSREKRPQHHHHFKAGAMNSLVSIIYYTCLNTRQFKSIKYSMCIVMDEEKGDEVAYVQFPQNFKNIGKNDIYGSSFRVINKDLTQMEGHATLAQDASTGEKLFVVSNMTKNTKVDWKKLTDTEVEESASLLEETCQVLASCTFERNTPWEKRCISFFLTCVKYIPVFRFGLCSNSNVRNLFRSQMGLKYGFLVEDVIKGLSMQCKGWKSVYLNPEREGFLGVAPMALLETLVQYKRWTEGHFEIFLSRYCPLLYGYGKIPLKLQLAYCSYHLWAANCLATLYYVAVPSLCLFKGFPLFPKVSTS